MTTAGIIVLPEGKSWSSDALNLIRCSSDVIFDIAINPDRGYAMSVRGLARELAGSVLKVNILIQLIQRVARKLNSMR